MAIQLFKSATSSALNYAESQSAESTKDFIHKLSIVLKELRETQVSLEIVDETRICGDSTLLAKLKSENAELVAVFVCSINTVKKNHKSTN